MVRFFDKLNTLRAVIVVLALFLVVDGFLFYRYRLTDTTAASAPPLEAVPAAAQDDAHSGEQEDEDQPGEEESGDEAAQPEDKNQGVLGTQESGSEPAPAVTPDAPASTPSEGNPTPVTAKDPAALPAPAPAYPEPVYEEGGDYQDTS